MLRDRRCNECGAQGIDLLEPSGQVHSIECPQCHLLTFKPLVSSCSIRFSGSGWTPNETKGNMAAYEKEIDKSTTIHL
jgi:predicted nucleic acid-binding Zn ribbon protein